MSLHMKHFINITLCMHFDFFFVFWWVFFGERNDVKYIETVYITMVKFMV